MTDLRPTARVARGATYLFIQGFSNAFLGLIYFIVLTHTFQDPSEQWQMGVFTLLSFILGLVQMFGTLALQSAAVKYIAQYLAEGDSEKAKSVVVRVLQMSFLASTIVFLSLFIPAEWVSSLMFGTVAHALLVRLIALCSILAILYLETSSFLQGMQRMFEVALLGLTYTVISTSVGICLLFLGMGLKAVVFGWLTALLIVAITGLILTAKYLGVLGKPYPIRPLLNFSLPLYISSGIGFWVGWIDQLLLVSYMSLILGTTEAQRILGIYYVAIRASAVPALFSSSIISALFPQLSELYTQQGSSSLKDAFRISARYSVLVGFPLIVGLATLAYPVIILFGGWQYVEATEPLIIISIAALAGTMGVAAGPILLTLERTKISSLLSVVSVVLSFLLSYFALAGLGSGMVGVAWARTLASIISLMLTLFAVTRYVPVSFDKEAILKASVASALLVASIVGLDLVRMLLSPPSFQQFLVFPLRLLPIYVIVGALAYFFSLVGLRAIKKQDVTLIHDYLPKNLKWVAEWLSRIAMVE